MGHLLTLGGASPSGLWSLCTLMTLLIALRNSSSASRPPLEHISVDQLKGKEGLGSANAAVRFYSCTLLALVAQFGGLQADHGLSATLEGLLNSDPCPPVKTAICCELTLFYNLRLTK